MQSDSTNRADGHAARRGAAGKLRHTTGNKSRPSTALLQVDEVCREVLLLREPEELSYKKIAAIIGAP